MIQISNISIYKELLSSLKKPSCIFISGIDTNVGKTYACAALANSSIKLSYNTITQKMIQTGCADISEDIEKHRELMELPLLKIDRDGTSSPIILPFPSSPHLAAKLANYKINLESIKDASNKLLDSYDLVLIEGAGGLMVPIIENNTKLGGYLTIDYIKDNNYPLILVTSSKLGSLNHTLLSLYACQQKGIEVKAIVYNTYPKEDELITKSSLEYLNRLNIPILLLNKY